MKKIIILLVVLGLGSLWFVVATPPKDFVFDENPIPAETEDIVTDEGDVDGETTDGSYVSLARELTEEEQAVITTAADTAKDGAILVTIATKRGEIELELFPNVAPGTVDNFVTLATEGFYDGITFHRVIDGFMIQGGDPNSKDDDPSNDGQGGPGYSFNDEINPHALGLSVDQIETLERQGYEYALDIPSLPMIRGVLAMANSGANTNGSQFFIVTESPQSHLDGKHTVFGEVISGMDVVTSIQKDDVIETITIETSPVL